MTYEEAIMWIEDEVHKHGIFEIKASRGDSYDYKTKITSRVPTGEFEGFTVSSQHVHGALNLLQMVIKMKNETDRNERR